MPGSRSHRSGRIASFSHLEFPLERVLALRRRSPARPGVSVCLPARDEAATIAPIIEVLERLRRRGAIDQVVVVVDSRDATGEIAASLGAEVHRQDSLMPELGPVLGKGDALWRSLAVLRGELICFLDADTRDFDARFVLGLVGVLLAEPGLSFVKGHYRRPLQLGGVTLPDGGGRVTELMARPLLRRLFPELADVRQPLAGELAARRELLERLPFLTGYGVDIALLIDAHREVGCAGLAQVDLAARQNAHQPLADLGPMADAVLDAVLTRAAAVGRLRETGSPAAHALERPPLVRLRAAA